MNYVLRKLLKLSFFLFTTGALAQSVQSGMPIVNGDINSIVRSGNTVFIGGAFTTVGGFARNHLAAFDANTGAVLPWAPNPDNVVNCLLIAGNRLFVGGNFLNISSKLQKYLAGFNLIDLSFATSTPISNREVWSLASHNGYLYYPIANSSIEALQLKRFNLSTNTTDSWVSDLLNGATQIYYDISGNYIYVGGDFYEVNNNYNYSYFTRLDLDSGKFDASQNYSIIGEALPILSVKSLNGFTYLAGNFTSINGNSYNGICQLDSNGNPTSLNIYDDGGDNYAIYPQGNTLWVGGNSVTIGYGYSYRISQIDLSTGYSTCWVTNAFRGDSEILSIFAQGDTVYTGSPAPTSGFKNSLMVLVGLPGKVTLTLDTLIAPGQSIVLDASSAVGVSYYWNNGATSPSITVTTPGTYSVTVTNEAYCQITNTVHISSPPVTTITVEPNSQNVCQGQSAIFSVSATGANLSYIWNNGAITPSITTSIPGLYTVTVSGTYGNVVSSTVGLGYLPYTNILSQPVSITTCMGISSQFSITATGAGLNYTWSNGSTNSILTTSTAGIYTVTVSGKCGYAISTPATLTLESPTTILATSGSATVCSGDSAIFSVTATGTNLTYLWNNGASTSYILTSTPGLYIVTVSGTCGKTKSTTDTLKLKASRTILLLSNVVTECLGLSATFSISTTGSDLSYSWSNGATTSSITTSVAGIYSVTTTGICGEITIGSVELVTISTCSGSVLGLVNETINDKFIPNIFPNPTNGDITIESREPIDYRISDSVGKIILSGSLNSGNNNLHLNYPSGVYYLISNEKIQKLVLE